MDESKIPREADESAGRRLEKNWSRFKWPVIGCLVALLILAAVITPILDRQRTDYRVLLYVDKMLPTGTADALAEELAQYGEDLDEDGQVELEVIDVSVGQAETNEQIQTALKVKRTDDLQSEDIMLLVCNQNTLKFFEETGVTPADTGNRFNWNGTQLQQKREEFIHLGVDVYFVLKSIPENKKEDKTNLRNWQDAERLLESIRLENEKK